MIHKKKEEAIMCVLVIILLPLLYNLELNIEIFWEAREIMTLYGFHPGYYFCSQIVKWKQMLAEILATCLG